MRISGYGAEPIAAPKIGSSCHSERSEGQLPALQDFDVSAFEIDSRCRFVIFRHKASGLAVIALGLLK